MNKFVSIARLDHWPKNIMILPGAFLALLVESKNQTLNIAYIFVLVQCFFGTCLIASANYSINEYLDREFDRHHPDKKNRVLVKVEVSALLVALQYCVLAFAGLFLLWQMNPSSFLGGFLLLLMGIVYNVKPLRSKEIPFLDVLTESINNPIRLLIGWGAFTTILMPPMSLMLSFWFGGAFLMATKRYAEFRYIKSKEIAIKYRRSFSGYTELSLLLSAYFYSIMSVFMTSVFLVKYKQEFLFSFPLIALIFTWYLGLSHSSNKSIAMEPEKIFHNLPFFSFFIFTCLVMLVLFFVEIPVASFIFEHNVETDFRFGKV